MFFDTVAGQRFTEGTLPSLVRELEKINERKQYTRKLSLLSLNNVISAEIEEGAKVVTMLDTKDGYAVVVFEK